MKVIVSAGSPILYMYLAFIVGKVSKGTQAGGTKVTCMSKAEEVAVSDGVDKEFVTNRTSNEVYSKVQSLVEILTEG